MDAFRTEMHGEFTELDRICDRLEAKFDRLEGKFDRLEGRILRTVVIGNVASMMGVAALVLATVRLG